MTTLKPWSDVVAEGLTFLQDADPVLAEIIPTIGPCALQPDPNIYEALVDAIISQQISVKAADAIVGRLRAATPGGVILPEALLQLDHEALRAAGLSTPKARYIQNLTARVASGDLRLEDFAQQDDETIIEALIAVKGIGRWTAEMILIFCLARTDVLPIDDLGFAEGVRHAYKLEARPTPKELRARGESWRPYRTFATWYLWQWRRFLQQEQRPRTRIVSL